MNVHRFNEGLDRSVLCLFFSFFQHSYGFIQCCDRQARLFFHFSQFDGNIEHLKIGDPVEFEMTYDRRTGKPIASAVSKIAPEVVLREERVIGKTIF